MIEEQLFCLLVANGIHIIIHNYRYSYTNSVIIIRTCMNKYLFKFKQWYDYYFSCTNKYNFTHHFRKHYR